MATFTALSSNYSKNYFKVVMAFLVILIYCASNNISSDYEIFNFEVNSKSAKPLPKRQQPNYPTQPVVEGWPPDVSFNLGDYLKPDVNTTLIKPNLPLNSQMLWRGENYSMTHILICVQSAVNHTKRRNLIRKTWAKVQKTLPAKVIFLIGVSSDEGDKKQIIDESIQNHDLLQEDFMDTYNNLTLKSMFMLKFSQTLSSSSVKYLMKVDDDSYINLRRLSDYVTIIDKRCNKKCIIGHVLGPDSPVIRPDFVEDEVPKWAVPSYIYQKETFPNAVSGSGYIISQAMVPCLFKSGLGIPFLNLEDIFITGLAASKCHIELKNSHWFNFVGKKTKLVKKTDILIHGVKTEERVLELYNKFQKIYTGS